MIFRWLALMLRFAWKLVVPAPPSTFVKIDPDLKCPVCGARDGRLRCVERKNEKDEVVTLCQHTCQVCGARFFNLPLVAVGSTLVHAAIARDELEEKEDMVSLRQLLNPSAQHNPLPERPEPLASKDKVN